VLEETIDLNKRIILKENLLKAGLVGAGLIGLSSMVNATSVFWRNESGDLTDLRTNLSGLVPYTGANTNTNLGTYSLTAGQVTVNGGTDSANLHIVADSDNIDESHTATLTLSQDGALITGGLGFASDNYLNLNHTGVTGAWGIGLALAGVRKLYVNGSGNTIATGTIGASNLSGTNTGDQDLSGLVPYTGATTDVNLGVYDLTTTGIVKANGNINMTSAVPSIIMTDTTATGNSGLIFFDSPNYINDRFRFHFGETSSDYPALFIQKQSLIGTDDLIFLGYNNNALSNFLFEAYRGKDFIIQTRMPLDSTAGDIIFKTGIFNNAWVTNERMKIDAGTGVVSINNGLSVGSTVSANGQVSGTSLKYLSGSSMTLSNTSSGDATITAQATGGVSTRIFLRQKPAGNGAIYVGDIDKTGGNINFRGKDINFECDSDSGVDFSFKNNNFYVLSDNGEILLGANSDASIYYDDTNMIINPKEVGSGILDVSGRLQTDGYNAVDGTSALEGTKVYYVSDTSGGAVTRKLTFKDGLLVSET